MYLISHRGNINGITEDENKPTYIDKAIKLGYHVEIDVWCIDGTYWLGHDKPEYKIDIDFLVKRRGVLWCHAKNLEALKNMLMNGIHCFWQHDDDYAVTSKGYIFTHSRITKSTNLSVIVSLLGNIELPEAAGICSDYIGKYKND